MIIQKHRPLTRREDESFDDFVYRVEYTAQIVIDDLKSYKEMSSVRTKYIDTNHAVIMYTKFPSSRVLTRKVIKNDV